MDSPRDLELRGVLDIYDEPWTEWTLRSAGLHLHPGREFATAYLVERAVQHGFAPGGRILEVASALGGPARMVARHFAATIVCIDMNPLMQRALRRISWDEGVGRRLQPVLARTERLPIRDRSLDGAWSQDAMCHMDKAPVVAEVARVLRPGSLFVFSDWIARGPLDRGDWALLAGHWGFPSLLTVADYVSLLAREGFAVLLAEDRTGALTAYRAPAADDQEAFERAYAARWGEAELERQKAPGEAWSSLVREGKMGFGAFVARRPA